MKAKVALNSVVLPAALEDWINTASGRSSWRERLGQCPAQSAIGKADLELFDQPGSCQAPLFEIRDSRGVVHEPIAVKQNDLFE